MATIRVEKQKGYKIGVEILDNYPLNFLHIFNNVRESEELVAITNNYANTVYVTGVEEVREELKHYLSQFGEIVFEEPVLIATLDDTLYYDTEYYSFVLAGYED